MGSVSYCSSCEGPIVQCVAYNGYAVLLLFICVVVMIDSHTHRPVLCLLLWYSIYMHLKTDTNREGTASRVMKDTGATFVHPYDHVDIMSGQGNSK